MSTQTDFAALVVRIDAATDRLEVDVQQLEALINDAEGSISQELIDLRDQARAAAAEAVVSAQQAANSATAAAESATDANGSYIAAQGEVTKAIAQVALASEQVGLAAAQVQLAKDQVTLAKGQVAAANTEANRAQTIADNLLATAPFDEAPKDGSTYGRNNGDWVVVDVPEGSLVQSVNGVGPDGSGNVQLAIPTKTSDLTNDSGFITAADIPAPPVVPTKVSELQNDTGFITLAQVPVVDVPTKTSELTNDSGFITASEVPPSPITTDAPSDGKQYARKDAAWSEVESSGGSSVVPFNYTKLSELGYDPRNGKVCFNYNLYNAVMAKGAWFINDPDTVNAHNSDADWMTEATYNPLGANVGVEAIDIRYFRVYSTETNGTVLGNSGAIWTGTVWQPGNALLGIVQQIVGEYSGGPVDASAILSVLPAGKWFYPKEIQNYTSGNEKLLPTDQLKVNHILLDKTTINFGGSETYPYGVSHSFKLLWISAVGGIPVASKGEYFLQRGSDTWINVGSLS